MKHLTKLLMAMAVATLFAMPASQGWAEDPSPEAIAAAEAAYKTPDQIIKEKAIGAATEAAQEAIDDEDPETTPEDAATSCIIFSLA